MSVALTAPEAFRFTFAAAPDRHVRAAQLLEPGVEVPDDPSALLPDVLIRLMRDIGIPGGVAAVGFRDTDVPELVNGALKQQRLLAIAPREPSAEDLTGIFHASMTLW
jgi:alcohol dehydrogenase class IV